MAELVASGTLAVDSTTLSSSLWTSSTPGVYAAFVKLEPVTPGAGDFEVGAVLDAGRYYTPGYGEFVQYWSEANTQVEVSQVQPWLDVAGTTDLHIYPNALSGETTVSWWVYKVSDFSAVSDGNQGVTVGFAESTPWISPGAGVYLISAKFVEIDPGAMTGSILVYPAFSDSVTRWNEAPGSGPIDYQFYEGDGGRTVVFPPIVDPSGGARLVVVAADPITGDFDVIWTVVRVQAIV